MSTKRPRHAAVGGTKPKKSQPTAEQKHQLEQWIKAAVFQADPQNPDPGRVTVCPFNRVE